MFNEFGALLQQAAEASNVSMLVYTVYSNTPTNESAGNQVMSVVGDLTTTEAYTLEDGATLLQMLDDALGSYIDQWRNQTGEFVYTYIDGAVTYQQN